MACAVALVLLALCATASIAEAATVNTTVNSSPSPAPKVSPTPSPSPKPSVNTYTKAYGTFYAAVSATKDASTCKQIIDTIGLRTALSNPKLALTIFVPSDTAFKTMAAKLKLSATSMTSSMTKNAGLMKQVMYYHFVTGSNGAKAVYPTWSLKAGTTLDTMYMSSTTKKHYQLFVGSAVGTKVLIKSAGTSAYTYMPNIKCGAGVAHGIDNLLLPMALTTIAKYI